MPKPLATAAIIMIALAGAACSSTERRSAPLPAAGTALPPAGGSMQGGQPGFVAGPQAGASAPMAGAGGSCNASAASSVVGELATSVAADQAKEATGAEEVRILFPNQPITQEFIAGRLNLETNDENRITSVRCG